MENVAKWRISAFFGFNQPCTQCKLRRLIWLSDQRQADDTLLTGRRSRSAVHRTVVVRVATAAAAAGGGGGCQMSQRAVVATPTRMLTSSTNASVESSPNTHTHCTVQQPHSSLLARSARPIASSHVNKLVWGVWALALQIWCDTIWYDAHWKTGKQSASLI